MGFPKLEVGDLVLTKLWNDAQSVEICQYRGATGNLMYTIYNPEILLECHLERFIKDTDSMPYNVSIVRKSDTKEYSKILESQLEAQNKPEVKEKISKGVKAAFKRPGVKEKHSAAVKKSLNNFETKKQSNSSKIRQRTGKHWQDYDLLYKLWIKLNRPKRGSFGTYISKLGYPKSNYHRLIVQFNEDYERSNNENCS